MKVLYFHQHFSTPAGSAGTRSYEFARRLVAAGHDVTMVCGSYATGDTGLSGPFVKGRREGVVDGIHVLELALAYSNDTAFLRRAMVFLSFARRTIGIALARDYDLVFATSTPLTTGIPGIAARWLRGKKFVFEVRDLWPELPRAMGVIRNPLVLGAMSILERATYRSAHTCIGLAPGITEGIIAAGTPVERVATIPNGCDLELFGEGTEPHEEVPGVEPDDFVAAYTGTHGKANGLDAVLDAAHVLKARGRRDVKLLLIGEGMEKARLMARAERDGLDTCVFLDRVPKTRLAEIMGRVDVGMQILDDVPAFYYGTSPNKFFDYLAQGKPVLVNYPGWVANLVKQWGCGWAVPPGDPQAFAERLIQLADDRDEARRAGRNARDLAREKFSRDELAGRFVQVLERTAARRQ